MVQGQYGHKVSETPISHISTTKLSTVAHICHPSYTEVMLRRTRRGCLVLPKKKKKQLCMSRILWAKTTQKDFNWGN
jgi:hypothetical protein